MTHNVYRQWKSNMRAEKRGRLAAELYDFLRDHSVLSRIFDKKCNRRQRQALTHAYTHGILAVPKIDLYKKMKELPDALQEQYAKAFYETVLTQWKRVIWR